MKIFIVALVIAAGYYYLLTATTDLALDQVQNMSRQYTQVVNQTDTLSNPSIALQ